MRKISRLIMQLLHIRKKPYLTVSGKRWDIYKSSSYMCITMELARFLYKEMTENKHLERYFKTSFVPEEFVIPTIVFNSSYRDRAILYPYNRYDGLNSLSAITYFNYGAAIKVFVLPLLPHHPRKGT